MSSGLPWAANRWAILLCVSAGLLAAQPFSFGVKAGGRLTGDLENGSATSESRRYTVGPMFTLGLPHGFALEVDALYRRVGYRTGSSDFPGVQYFERDRGNSWEFPMVLRKTLWRGLYAGVGYAPRVINGSGHADSVSVVYLDPPTKAFSEFQVPGQWDTTHGVLGAAGIEKRLGPVRIATEVRYVYWNHPSLEIFGSRGFSVVSSQHQVDLLVGLTFP